jgi:hypothetical protein
MVTQAHVIHECSATGAASLCCSPFKRFIFKSNTRYMSALQNSNSELQQTLLKNVLLHLACPQISGKTGKLIKNGGSLASSTTKLQSTPIDARPTELVVDLPQTYSIESFAAIVVVITNHRQSRGRRPRVFVAVVKPCLL